MFGKKKQNIVERLLKRTTIPLLNDGSKDISQCWLWRGPTNNAGYGLMNVGHSGIKMASVHRIMMVEHVKSLQYKTKQEVLHICGKKLCVNPDHLILGTMKDRHALQRKFKAYNQMFHDKDYMYPICEHCGGTTYLPHFKRMHSLCKRNAKHKYTIQSISGKQ